MRVQKPKAQVIADHYELKNQTVKAMEELAELIQALSKGERAAILEEMADVCVMLEQMMYFYDIGKIELETVMDIKMDRQLHRMKEGD